jgi:hypothetical protein
MHLTLVALRSLLQLAASKVLDVSSSSSSGRVDTPTDLRERMAPLRHAP